MLPWGIVDKNQQFLVSHYAIINNKVKIHNDFTFGSKYHFFIAASLKSAVKIRFRPGKYAG